MSGEERRGEERREERGEKGCALTSYVWLDLTSVGEGTRKQ